MAGNSFGTIFRLASFGESHGPAIGGVIDGCPAGLAIDFVSIEKEMKRRMPSQSDIATKRKEPDKVEFLSGIFEGKTTGAPIGFIIKNKDTRSRDYSHLKDSFRPSHADLTYESKYGSRDYRGGGRASARETAIRVAAGAIAKQLLAEQDIKINAYVSQIGKIKSGKSYEELDLGLIESNSVRCPDKIIADKMIDLIKRTKTDGDTLGGIISCVVKNVPPGLGEPVFDKANAELAKAMLSINAVKGFEIGSGFTAASMKGSEHNDPFIMKSGKIATSQNFSGGIQGGITNGSDIFFRVAFKPVATLMKDQESVDREGHEVIIKGKGRHDVCVVPRAVPIVEAMAALVLADLFLRNKVARI